MDEYGLIQGNKGVPEALPEFALNVTIGDIEMMKIVWVCNDSFGLSVYYPVGNFDTGGRFPRAETAQLL